MVVILLWKGVIVSIKESEFGDVKLAAKWYYRSSVVKVRRSFDCESVFIYGYAYLYAYASVYVYICICTFMSIY